MQKVAPCTVTKQWRQADRLRCRDLQVAQARAHGEPMQNQQSRSPSGLAKGGASTTPSQQGSSATLATDLSNPAGKYMNTHPQPPRAPVWTRHAARLRGGRACPQDPHSAAPAPQAARPASCWPAQRKAGKEGARRGGVSAHDKQVVGCMHARGAHNHMIPRANWRPMGQRARAVHKWSYLLVAAGPLLNGCQVGGAELQA